MDPVFQIILGFALFAITMAIHLAAVTLSLRRVTARVAEVRALGSARLKTTLVLTYVLLLGLALLIQAMIWAWAFVALGVTDTFWQAVYFAIVTLTTLGYGDLTPHGGAQLVAAFCAVAGLFLVGLSTAFVVEILRRLEMATDQA